MFFKIRKKLDKKNDQQSLLNIAKLISNDNEEVMKEAQQCIIDPKDYFNTHLTQYEERGIQSCEDVDTICWLGLVDILTKAGFVKELDFSCEVDEFTDSIHELITRNQMDVTFEEDWFNEEESIEEWFAILSEKWKLCPYVAAIDIDSDSYVLFIIYENDFNSLVTMAKQLHHRIDLAENM